MELVRVDASIAAAERIVLGIKKKQQDKEAEANRLRDVAVTKQRQFDELCASLAAMAMEQGKLGKEVENRAIAVNSARDAVEKVVAEVTRRGQDWADVELVVSDAEVFLSNQRTRLEERSAMLRNQGVKQKTLVLGLTKQSIARQKLEKSIALFSDALADSDSNSSNSERIDTVDVEQQAFAAKAAATAAASTLEAAQKQAEEAGVVLTNMIVTTCELDKALKNGIAADGQLARLRLAMHRVRQESRRLDLVRAVEEGQCAASAFLSEQEEQRRKSRAAQIMRLSKRHASVKAEVSKLEEECAQFTSKLYDLQQQQQQRQHQQQQQQPQPPPLPQNLRATQMTSPPSTGKDIGYVPHRPAGGKKKTSRRNLGFGRTVATAVSTIAPVATVNTTLSNNDVSDVSPGSTIAPIPDGSTRRYSTRTSTSQPIDLAVGHPPVSFKARLPPKITACSKTGPAGYKPEMHNLKPVANTTPQLLQIKAPASGNDTSDASSSSGGWSFGLSDDGEVVEPAVPTTAVRSKFGLRKGAAHKVVIIKKGSGRTGMVCKKKGQKAAAALLAQSKKATRVMPKSRGNGGGKHRHALSVNTTYSSATCSNRYDKSTSSAGSLGSNGLGSGEVDGFDLYDEDFALN